MFVYGATHDDLPANPDPATDRAPSRVRGTPSVRIIGLIRNLVIYGKELLITLRQQRSDTVATDLHLCFGTLSVTLIIARIRRGLMLAQALEQRLIRVAKRLDRPRTAPSPAASDSPAEATALDASPADSGSAGPHRRRAKPYSPASFNDDALLERLPTVAEIAAQLRKRSIGDGLADICHDLGITAGHPLWPDIRAIMTHHGSGFIRLVDDMTARMQQDLILLARRLGETMGLPLALTIPRPEPKDRPP